MWLWNRINNMLRSLALRTFANILRFSRRCGSTESKSSNAVASRPHLYTTPIFYVNAAPHLGHVYSALLADVQHRYSAMCGTETKLSTGTDEHGMKVQQAASALGLDPQRFCSSVSLQFQSIFDALDISYTDFVRTTEPRHIEAVSRFWMTLEEQGYIYKGTYEGWYCTSDEAFLSEGQTTECTNSEGSKIRVSLESGHQVHWVSEENYMFRLSSLRPALLNWLQTEPVHPAPFLRLVHHWLDEELPDLSVSRQRSRLSWGIPVPSDSSHVIYVWLDALVNYLTAAGYPNPQLAPWGPSTHILGKDILRFHAIYWPAFLIAAGLPPPQKLLVHSHWTSEGTKMSKSLKNVVDPSDCIRHYTTDGLRYYLLRHGAPEKDCDFTHHTARMLLNSELADALGGLLNRCTAPAINPMQHFPKFQYDSFPSGSRDQLHNLLATLEELPAEVDQWVKKFQVHKALESIDACVRRSNAFFQSQAPWKLQRGVEKEAALRDSVIYLTLEALRLYATLLHPAVPGLATAILDRLGVPHRMRTLKKNTFLAATKGDICYFQAQNLGPDKGVLFPRLEKSETF